MELKGSFTIEAALIMPLILGTIVALLYMSFFLHDNAVIKEGTILLTNRYTNERNLSNTQIKQKIQENIRPVILDKVIVTKNITTTIEVENKLITISSSGTFQFPSMYIVTTIFNRGNITISTTKSIKRYNPVAFIRNCRIVEDLIN
jgi:hypothetical protein